jgi:hypothetical protein
MLNLRPEEGLRLEGSRQSEERRIDGREYAVRVSKAKIGGDKLGVKRTDVFDN